MRFESKHKYFKGLTNVIGNFINSPYTLAMQHQLFQCFLRFDPSQSSTVSLIEVGKGQLFLYEICSTNVATYICICMYRSQCNG